jgi:hypothetical protein
VYAIEEKRAFASLFPAGCEVRLHTVPKVATGRSGALAVKREGAGWMYGWK